MTESRPLRSVDRRDLTQMEAYYLARIEALQAEIRRLHKIRCGEESAKMLQSPAR